MSKLIIRVERACTLAVPKMLPNEMAIDHVDVKLAPDPTMHCVTTVMPLYLHRKEMCGYK